jgi:stage III sporulation protein AE
MKKTIFVIIFIVCVFGFTNKVQASEYGDIDSYNFDDLQKILDTDLSNKDMEFVDVVKGIISGDSENVFKNLFGNLKDSILAEITYNKDALVRVIIIAILAAFLTSLSAIVTNNQISETGFFITYMLLITILLAAFTVITNVASTVISQLLDFMRALIPSYFLAVGFAGGSLTSMAFYEITLVLITVVNYLFLYIIIPAINIYVVLLLINNVSKEDFISRLADLLKTIINWTLKTILGVVLGINVIQSMCLPIADSLKTTALKKAVTMIPGVGNATNAITQVLIGSGTLIKNGIGAAALVLIVVICITPVLKLCIFSIMYQGTAAIIQPISDKRIINCILSVSEGTKLLIRVVVTGAILFIITIAIICIATNVAYYSG